eukprot:667435-Amphidinium_carterae.1
MVYFSNFSSEFSEWTRPKRDPKYIPKGCKNQTLSMEGSSAYLVYTGDGGELLKGFETEEVDGILPTTRTTCVPNDRELSNKKQSMRRFHRH